MYTRATDARTVCRPDLHLAAALYCDGVSSAVRIRNISSAGALLHGLLVPDAGSLVQLVRGGLIVHGLVAWAEQGRCGIKFSGTVDVEQWRAVPGNSEQERVDEVVRLVKAGAVPLPVPPLDLAEKDGDPAAELSGDLGRALALLDCLGEALAADRDIVTGHATALQNLDIAMQVIAAVQAIVTGESDPQIDATKLSGLRRSADQALRG